MIEDRNIKQNKSFESVLLARHPDRPYSMDLFETIFEDFIEIHGDRRYADDPAMVCGFAGLDNQQVLVIGHQKGRDTAQRRYRNFGMPKPEGYRKSLRAMKLAEKFGRPIVTIIDTPGAYPGIDAEERGQAEAIAFNLREMANLKVPVVIVVLGEGGSGGALAIGVGDKILMLENSVYSVITPEGCAAILWKDSAQAPRAAECLKMTAANLFQAGIVDFLIKESEDWRFNGAVGESKNAKQNNETYEQTALKIKKAILDALDELNKLSVKELLDKRYSKFRSIGEWVG